MSKKSRAALPQNQACGPAVAPIGAEYSKGGTPGVLSTPWRQIYDFQAAKRVLPRTTCEPRTVVSGQRLDWNARAGVIFGRELDQVAVKSAGSIEERTVDHRIDETSFNGARFGRIDLGERRNSLGIPHLLGPIHFVSPIGMQTTAGTDVE